MITLVPWWHTSKKSKIEQLLSVTIGYLATRKVSKDPTHWKRTRILLDSGFVATLINHSLIKSLDYTKEKKPVDCKS
jgi:hypothetical protein